MSKGRKLTRKERGEIRKLVTTMCANYDKTYDCCPLLDDYGCYMLTRQFTDSGLCKYFQSAVLPLNPELEAVFTGKRTKPCRICGKRFAPVGRQGYCSGLCENTGTKAATAKRVKKHRENKRSDVTE